MGAGGEAHAPPPGPGPIVSDGATTVCCELPQWCSRHRPPQLPASRRRCGTATDAAVRPQLSRRGVTPWRDPRGAGALQRVCAFNPLKSLTCMRCVSLHGSDAGAGTAPGPGGACRRGRGGARAPAPARGGDLGGPALQLASGQAVEGAERLRSRTAFAAGAAHRLQPSASAPQAPGPPDAALRALSSRRPGPRRAAAPVPVLVGSSRDPARARPAS
eukprot:tig00021339_g20416.t1